MLAYHKHSDQALAGSRRTHPGRRAAPITFKLLLISFTPFYQVIRCPPRGLRHSEGGTKNNTRVGRRCFGRRISFRSLLKLFTNLRLRDLHAPSYALPAGADFLASISASDFDDTQWSYDRLGDVGQTTLNAAT
ncbi:hypothetical protein CSKR_101596 [Clonorchis sinensis]|uniref:Uncharacterized protein n=1 Tax=Clonorchis sinensis TaxID=79923 RepID=A0A3R7C7R9_CLOSI|nr:hypothetical protein CSKR_101596 [Clonorchis sinensis]